MQLRAGTGWGGMLKRHTMYWSIYVSLLTSIAGLLEGDKITKHIDALTPRTSENGQWN